MKSAGQHPVADRAHRPATRHATANVWLALGLAPAALVLVLCTRDALAWVGRPFAGFLFGDRGVVFSIGRSSWRPAQLRPVEWAVVTDIDGRPIGDGPAIHAAIAAAEIGRKLTITFERGTEVFRLAIPTRAFTWNDFAVVFLPMLAVGAWVIAAGASLLVLRPDLREARATFAFFLPFGLALITGPDQYGPYRFTWLFFLSLGIFPASLINLATGFLWQHSHWRMRVVTGAYTVFGALGGALVLFQGEPAVFLPLLYIAYLALANSLLLYMGVLGSALVSGQRFRPLAAVLLSGALLPAGIAIAIFVTYPLRTEPISVPWLILPMAIWPVLHAVALLRLAEPEQGAAACARA